MNDTPRGLYEHIESRLRDINAANLGSEIQDLIRTRNVTRANLNDIQNRRKVADDCWRNAWNTVNRHGKGLERTMVLDLINDRITTLNSVQMSLNQLYRTV